MVATSSVPCRISLARLALPDLNPETCEPAMQMWMTVWTIVLVAAVVGFLGLIVGISAGAVQELKESLRELRADAQESQEHPEMLDERT